MGGRPRLASKERTRTWGTIRALSVVGGFGGRKSPGRTGGGGIHLCAPNKKPPPRGCRTHGSRANNLGAPKPFDKPSGSLTGPRRDSLYRRGLFAPTAPH